MKGEYIFLSTRKILVTSFSHGVYFHRYYRKNHSIGGSNVLVGLMVLFAAMDMDEPRKCILELRASWSKRLMQKLRVIISWTSGGADL